VRKEYYKLVRDRIPEIIRQGEEHCEVVTLTEPDFQQALRQKLAEEAQEAAIATEANLVTELADLYEVIQALMSTYGVSEEMVRQVQAERRTERGGFTQRVLLLWTEEVSSE
jgi:predicted house-cleaning noncanonical NTP pyrophosphatase (MazG superfamily)